MRVFVAGATGVVGRRLVPLLLSAGCEVHGTTRRRERADALRAQGVTPVILDVFDEAAVRAAVVSARPELVIHQLTDLAQLGDPETRAAALAANARIRIEGTRHLVDAALAAGARRLVAQSIAFVYAPGLEPHDESDPLDDEAVGLRGVTVAGVRALEAAVLNAQGVEGVVLRYGQFYGPGSGTDAPPGQPSLHVDAAACAAWLAGSRGHSGVYNIVDDGPSVLNQKAVRELGWSPAWRLETA